MAPQTEVGQQVAKVAEVAAGASSAKKNIEHESTLARVTGAGMTYNEAMHTIDIQLIALSIQAAQVLQN